MMRSILTATAFIVAAGTAQAASELKGADIVTMLSGNSYACQNKAKDKSMSMQFPALSPASQEIPYTYKLDGKTASGAYVFKSNGKKVASKSSGQSRRFMKLSDNTVQIIGRSGQYWVCTES